jgi:transposase
MERTIKVQDVMLQAMAKKITWWQAAEILGISDRHMRRWRERYEQEGYNGLLERRRGKPSRRRVALALVEKVLALYREKYFDLKVQHFHEKLEAEHGIGRSERNFGTWQGRLPQELRLHQIATLEAANQFLREHYVADFNRRFQVAAAQRGTAFMPCRSRDLERIFSLQCERAVGRDNTVSFQNLRLQLERVGWRATLAGCQVTVHQHLDGTLSITHGPHLLGRYTAAGAAQSTAKMSARRAVEKPRAGKVINPTFPPRLEIPQRTRDSHFPTAPTPGLT